MSTQRTMIMRWPCRVRGTHQQDHDLRLEYQGEHLMSDVMPEQLVDLDDLGGGEAAVPASCSYRGEAAVPRSSMSGGQAC
jgi:hypothetical protein